MTGEKVPDILVTIDLPYANSSAIMLAAEEPGIASEQQIVPGTARAVRRKVRLRRGQVC